MGGNGEKTNKKVIEDICKLLNKFSNDGFDHFNLVKKVTDKLVMILDMLMIHQKFQVN